MKFLNKLQMKILYKISEVRDYIEFQQKENKSIGFVPTMGALHQGHLALVKQSVAENNITICSIFVNPTQFNNKEDLEKYPRTLNTDLDMLKSVDCDAVFVPSVEEMYPNEENIVYDLGGIDLPMEGRFRPGHFNGVAIIVKKLFDIVTPNKAYFGEKDFQQLAIIEYLVKSLQIPIQIVPCKIVREADGLAMSSRNTRLTANERLIAPFIYKTLQFAVNNYKNYNPNELKLWIEKEFELQKDFKLEYVEIVNHNTLQTISKWNDAEHVNICIAVFLGNVRLIDNVRIF